MGEYAMYEGERVKIGTCESMYYLRADQADKVQPLHGNVDPIEDGASGAIRFRFPWPDEDDIEPGGAFEPYDRGIVLEGMTVPTEGVEHYRDDCPGEVVELVQQRWLDGALVGVCRCGDCGAMYRMPELEHALPVLDALEVMGEEEVKRRLQAGYSSRVSVRGIAEVYADPATAALLAGRVERGEVSADEIRAALNGEHNPRQIKPAGYITPEVV